MARKSAPPRSAAPKSSIRRILAIDIGATGIKAALIGPDGKFLSEPVRMKTPDHCTPKTLVPALAGLVRGLQNYDRVSIGFPGYVRGGKVFTAPNLGTKAWAGFKLEAAMRETLKAPIRIHNDADVQGLAVISGKGLELVCTLGTGLGTAWFRDGELMPHMDLAHMTIHARDDFDRYLGDKALKREGHKTWNKRVQKMVAMLNRVFFYDHLYLGGGNSRHVKFKLPRNVSIVSNDAGMEGGAFVWLPRSGK
jgi:polyphosphate glucokinase